eukprot:m51a1_g11578 hypothetical protein (512) ;mRNA; r:38668-40777
MSRSDPHSPGHATWPQAGSPLSIGASPLFALARRIAPRSTSFIPLDLNDPDEQAPRPQSPGAASPEALSASESTEKRQSRGGDGADAADAGQALEGAGDTFERVARFVMQLAETLHRSGVPTERLERQIPLAAAAYGVEVECAVFPTMVLLSMRDKATSEVRTVHVPCEFSWDLDKQDFADSLAKRVASHSVPLAQAAEELARIRARPPVYTWQWKLLAMTLMSPMVCPWFYGGGAYETALSLVLGFVAGVILLAADKFSQFARIADCVTAILVAAIVVAVDKTRWLGPLSQMSANLAGIYWALPGLQLIKALGDLGAHMTVAGSARFLYGLLVIFELGFGIALGSQVGLLIPDSAVAATSSEEPVRVPTVYVSAWYTLLCLPVGVVTFGVVMNAHPRQYAAIIVCSAFADLTSRMVTHSMGSDAAIVLGMVALCFVANVYSKVFDKPAAVPTAVSALVIVSSSLGVRGVAAGMVDNDLVKAMHCIFGMMMTVICIVIGNFFADLIQITTI